MSRLESFIRRMQAQHTCLNDAISRIEKIPGIVVELGLGNGRTYDHLRENMPNREIHVFERKVNAHPSCIPPDEFLQLGEIQETMPAFAEAHQTNVALLHGDIGSGDPVFDQEFLAWLAPLVEKMLMPEGLALFDQRLATLERYRIELPEGVPTERYFYYHVHSSSSSSST